RKGFGSRVVHRGLLFGKEAVVSAPIIQKPPATDKRTIAETSILQASDAPCVSGRMPTRCGSRADPCRRAAGRMPTNRGNTMCKAHRSRIRRFPRTDQGRTLKISYALLLSPAGLTLMQRVLAADRP